MYVHCIQKKIALEQSHNVLELSLWKCSYNQLQKCGDTAMKNQPFLFQIAASHIFVRYNTHLHSKLFLQVLSMVLYCPGGDSQYVHI